KLPCGRKACAAAGGAKRLRYRGDEAYFTAAVVEAPALRHLAAVVLRDWVHGAALVDARRQFPRRDHHLGPPVIAIADVHEFDETHDHRCAAKGLDKIERGV